MAKLHKKWQGSKWLRPSTRARLYMRDAHTCVYCGKSIYTHTDIMLTIDHVQPRELGGTNVHGNLVTACKSCNCAKKDKKVSQFIAYLGDQGVDTSGMARRVRNAQRRKLPKIGKGM